MNEHYIQSVIDDRKKEVYKIVEDNQIYSHLRGSDTSQREFTQQGEGKLRFWMMRVGKRLKGVFTINNKGGVKV
jgi:hypothetical protein